jgi:glycosyltransferase involved in cell wall biosynthesis
MSSPRRVLWVVPKWPFPASDGARVATVALLREVARTAPSIDLLVFSDEPIDEAKARTELGVARTFAARIGKAGLGPRRWPDAARALIDPRAIPLTLARFRRPDLLRASLPEDQRWGAVVFDGLHGAAAFFSAREPRVAERFGRVYYRAHNVEWELWDQSARSASGLARFALQAQARAVRGYETALVRAANAVLPVSEEDRRRFSEAVPQARLETLPIGLVFSDPPELRVPAAKLKLLFLGKLDWSPNRDGLLWFLREVWPAASARRKDLELVVAGSGDAGPLRRSGLLEQDRVAFLGRVPDVAPLYADCAAALVPIFLGSGTRVKAIEAARFARVCVSTALGVEGIGLEAGRSYLRADSAAEWIEALAGLEAGACAGLGRAAFELARREFDASAIGDRLARLLLG